MNGKYLIDLYDEIVQSLPDLNLELVQQGGNELTEISDMFVKKNLRKRPYMLVDLSDQIIGKAPCHEGIDVVEEVPLKLMIYVTGDQKDALLYEGVVKSFIKNSESSLRGKITSAYLGNILPLSSIKRVDEDVKNSNGWVIDLRFKLIFNWE